VLCGRIDTDFALPFWPYCVPLWPIEQNRILMINNLKTMIKQILILIFSFGLYYSIYGQDEQIKITSLPDSVINNSGA
jgi:hypothetical protein